MNSVLLLQYFYCRLVKERRACSSKSHRQNNGTNYCPKKRIVSTPLLYALSITAFPPALLPLSPLHISKYFHPEEKKWFILFFFLIANPLLTPWTSCYHWLWSMKPTHIHSLYANSISILLLHNSDSLLYITLNTWTPQFYKLQRSTSHT